MAKVPFSLSKETLGKHPLFCNVLSQTHLVKPRSQLCLSAPPAEGRGFHRGPAMHRCTHDGHPFTCSCPTVAHQLVLIWPFCQTMDVIPGFEV